MKSILNSKKAQAAVTDSLFFLLVIVGLCVLMFSYSADYGSRVNEATNDLYFKEFTNSAMKTIFYTTVPLDFSLDYEESLEVDYLITSIKSDFYDDQKIGVSDINKLDLSQPNLGDITKFNLYNVIKSLMIPLNNYDFVFYFYNTSESGRFEFFLTKNTNFTLDDYDSENDTPGYSGSKSASLDSYSYYLCQPYTDSEVINILSKAGKIYSSSIPLNFVTSSSESIDVTSTFAIWPATYDVNSTHLIDSLNCEEIETYSDD